MTRPEAADIVERFTPLIKRLTGEAGSRYPNLYSDFLSDAFLKVWRAALSFSDPRYTFGAVHIAKVVRWAIWQRLKDERKRNPQAFHQRIEDSDGEPFDLHGVADTSTPEVSVTVEVQDLLELLQPERRGEVVRYYLHNETAQAIAGSCGATETVVRQRISASLVLMRLARRARA
jgi:DNA-directed RNA polymerase specialized sigma24 family protein